VPRSVFLGWSNEDRAWSLALMQHEADICSGCGLPSSETHDPTNEYNYTATPTRCHACASASHAGKDGKIDSAGLSYRIERRS